MKKFFTLVFLVVLFSGFHASKAQDYSFTDFVGTWQGNITSTHWGGSNYPTTLVIEPNGFYTESSGQLMPTIYPNTQECEFEAETNRMHFWYLKTVYAGQYFYQHFFYEVVHFQNDTLEMHYNYWDDPVPHPDVETIFLVRQTSVGVDDNIALIVSDGDKELLKVIDLMGRKRDPDTKGEILIFQYSDGTVRKVFNQQ